LPAINRHRGADGCRQYRIGASGTDIMPRPSMSIEKHDLHHEFPEYGDAIHALKVSDSHFAALFDQYHDIDREVRRIEAGIENTSDAYLEQRKKERLHLKDALYERLRSWTGK
jgi:uncharacterized protein YdcH (DUF465 family)